MLTVNHPNTLYFMEFAKKICDSLDFNFFPEKQYVEFLKNDNFMQLPS